MSIKDKVNEVEAKVEVQADKLIGEFQEQKHTGRIILIIVGVVLGLMALSYQYGYI